MPVILTDRGKKIMDDLRGVVAEMEDREQQLLDERNAAANASADRTIWTIAVWMPIALLVLAVAAVVLMRTVRFGGPAAPPSTPGKKWGGIAIRYASAVIVVAVAVVLQMAVGGLLRPSAPVSHLLSGSPPGSEHRRRRAGDRGHRALGAGGRLLVHPAVWVVPHRGPE